jgi:uncharacterized glyoxalase superfamily protein PhnB
MATCVPFLRVSDIAETIKWYESIGFKCNATNHFWEPDCELNWAEIEWQGATFMLYPLDDKRVSKVRDAGLYFSMETIDGIADNLRGKVKIIEETDETFYGRREVVFEDLNGFMITFSCLPKKN